MDSYLRKRLIILPVTWIAIILIHTILLGLCDSSPESWLASSTLQYDASMLMDFEVPSLLNYFLNTITFSFGDSIFYKQPVTQLVLSKIPTSFYLTIASFIPLYLSSIYLGVFVKQHRTTLIYNILTAYSAIPNCLAYAYLFFLNYRYGIFVDNGQFIAVLLLTIRRLAPLTSFIANIYQREKDKPYIKMAYIRQVPQHKILIFYILKNALIPVWVRAPKHFFQILFSGTLSVEVLFSIDGLGRLTFMACKYQDYPLIMGCLMISCIMVSIGYLVGDFIQTMLTPNIKIG